MLTDTTGLGGVLPVHVASVSLASGTETDISFEAESNCGFG